MRARHTRVAETVLAIVKVAMYIYAGVSFYDLVTKVNYLIERCQ